MPVDIHTYLDTLMNSHSISKVDADCIYQEYLSLKDNYLAGKLQSSTLEALNKIRAMEERARTRQNDSIPTVEDMALFTLAKDICNKIEKA